MKTVSLPYALVLVRKLEPIAAEYGAHLGIIGSTLIKGESQKDLDIIVYPHDVSIGVRISDFLDRIESIGFTDRYLCASNYRDDKTIYTFNYEGIRVEFFFFYR